ncbi:MAG: CBS domain-containing protein [Bdellovibrionales bacterium]|nr:CBS domain-containing protein [Bdellovibrionales bacterium]
MENTPASRYKIASDIMTKKPFVLQSSMTISEASSCFLNHHFSSAPVMSAAGEVMGILDEFSLIKIKLVQHLDENGRDKLAFHKDFFQQATFVKESTQILDVVKEMMKAYNNRLWVLNNAKALVGIISPKDVLRYVVGEKKKQVDLQGELEKAKNDLDKVVAELQQTKGKLDMFEDMVMDNPTMIHSVNKSGTIIMANRKMHELLGYENGELVGKTMFNLYVDSVHAEAVSGLKKIMKSGQHQNTFTTMIKKNGDKIRVDISSTALLDDAGDFIGTISVSRPVDADILLRALHGVLSKDTITDDKMREIRDILETTVEVKK